MARKFSQRSLDNLLNVHPDLIRVVAAALAASPVDFSVIEGRRTRERQAQLVKSGASRTMNSRHLHGLAVDLLPIDPKTGKGAFDWTLYHQLGPAMKRAAADLGIPITWGGDWTTFKDGPHFELPHALYPDGMKFKSMEPANIAAAVPGSVLVPPIPNPEPEDTWRARIEERLARLEMASIAAK